MCARLQADEKRFGGGEALLELRRHWRILPCPWSLGSDPSPLHRFHLLSRSELENHRLGPQFALIVSLILALYLVLKLRHRRPVLRPLGWVWPRTVYVIVAPLLGVLLATLVVFSLPPVARSEPADHAARRDSDTGIGARPDP